MPALSGFFYGLFRKVIEIAKDDLRVNRAIKARECVLVGYDGTQMGNYAVTDALDIAQREGLDLVEVSQNQSVPVCRIMDYGKYKYERSRKEKANRKKAGKIETKEMKFRPKIDVGDYDTKKKHVLRFLGQGNRVKITIMFRGREMAHPEHGLNLLEKLSSELEEIAVVEAAPKMEGRNMFMTIAPLPDFVKKSQSEIEKKETTGKNSRRNREAAAKAAEKQKAIEQE